MTIRTVHKDTVTALPYAKQDMVGFVLYFNLKFNDQDNQILQKTTIDLIDVAEKAGGTYYLPYQLLYSQTIAQVLSGDRRVLCDQEKVRSHRAVHEHIL